MWRNWNTLISNSNLKSHFHGVPDQLFSREPTKLLVRREWKVFLFGFSVGTLELRFHEEEKKRNNKKSRKNVKTILLTCTVMNFSLKLRGCSRDALIWSQSIMSLGRAIKVFAEKERTFPGTDRLSSPSPFVSNTRELNNSINRN